MKKETDEVSEFRSLLKEKGLKFTLERKQLLEEIIRYKGHFDADSLYQYLKDRNSPISRDTVYRTLPILLECGVIQKSVGDSRREHYERPGAKGHHDHLVCIRCQRVIEFQSEAIEEAQAKVCRKLGFKLLFHDHRLFGYCAHCLP